MKQDFLAIITHEFRTLITVVQGYLGLLEGGEPGVLTPGQMVVLRITRCNIDQLNRMVNDVLDFSSLARGQFFLDEKLISVSSLLSQALQRTEDAVVLKGICLRQTTDHPAATIMGDEERLARVIAHLLENGIEYSKARQIVALSSAMIPHQIAITVRDAGIGMTREQLARAFMPFTQRSTGLSRHYDGPGMGLPLIHNLVTLHGGEISIDSTPGKGTAVTLVLPVSSEK